MLEAFSLRLGARPDAYCHYIFSTALELLANAVRQEKWVRGIRIGKKDVKLTVFADDIIVYLEMPTESMIKLT